VGASTFGGHGFGALRHLPIRINHRRRHCDDFGGHVDPVSCDAARGAKHVSTGDLTSDLINIELGYKSTLIDSFGIPSHRISNTKRTPSVYPSSSFDESLSDNRMLIEDITHLRPSVWTRPGVDEVTVNGNLAASTDWQWKTETLSLMSETCVSACPTF
jgi:hypothetical protein